MQHLPLSGPVGSVLVLAPYVLGVLVEVVTGGPTWPSLWRAIPTWFDVVALLAWSSIGSVIGGRAFAWAYSGHVVGVAGVASFVGYLGSTVVVTDPDGAAFGAVVLFLLVVLLAGVTWSLAGLTARRKVSAPSSPAYRAWLVLPYLVIGLRWLG
ncbi:MAG: hypothetical protein KGS10_14500 [Chloroflexi bacterium]|nr:hypothetical protein [Chloroflexota bacterium]